MKKRSKKSIENMIEITPPCPYGKVVAYDTINKIPVIKCILDNENCDSILNCSHRKINTSLEDIEVDI